MQWYLRVLKNYATFRGRARRKEYWMFMLFNAIFSIVAGIIDQVAGIYPAISAIYYLAVLIPSLAVLVRRLHDTGRSGWWILIAFIPVIGGIVLFVFTLLDSQESDNKWGPNPKRIDQSKSPQEF